MGEITDRVCRKNTNLETTLPLTISAEHGLIDQSIFFDKRIASKDLSGYYLINEGEFAYNKSTSVNAKWGTIKRLDNYKNGALSTLYIIFKIRNLNLISSDFIVTYYETTRWHKDIRSVACEGARNHGLLNITAEDFFKTKIKISKSVDEQNLIGKLFFSLNNLITLHQRKQNLNFPLTLYIMRLHHLLFITLRGQ